MPTIITVTGMSCGHCERAVEDALRNVPGVTDARADGTANRATIDGDVDPAALVRAVEDIGYGATA